MIGSVDEVGSSLFSLSDPETARDLGREELTAMEYDGSLVVEWRRGEERA